MTDRNPPVVPDEERCGAYADSPRYSTRCTLPRGHEGKYHESERGANGLPGRMTWPIAPPVSAVEEARPQLCCTFAQRQREIEPRWCVKPRGHDGECDWQDTIDQRDERIARRVMAAVRHEERQQADWRDHDDWDDEEHTPEDRARIEHMIGLLRPLTLPTIAMLLLDAREERQRVEALIRQRMHAAEELYEMEAVSALGSLLRALVQEEGEGQ